MQPRNFFKLLLTTTLVLLALSLTALADDQKPASMLVYNYYHSSARNPVLANTAFNLTNTAPRASVFVHLLFIQSDTCTTMDAFTCLTPNQTITFLASDVDPGIKGYMVVVATDEKGCPINFNYLIGSEAVKWEDGRMASFGAEGFKALYNGTGQLPGWKENSAVADVANIDLDGKIYEAAPRSLAVDKIGSMADGNSTLVVVNSLSGTARNMTKIGSMFGMLYDDVERGSSFVKKDVGCQLSEVLSDGFPLTSPLFSAKIPAERTGWMNITASEAQGITGAVINFNPGTATRFGAFNSSHNLHHLGYTAARLTIPVYPPSC